jgi:hypothetical protein
VELDKDPAAAGGERDVQDGAESVARHAQGHRPSALAPAHGVNAAGLRQGQGVQLGPEGIGQGAICRGNVVPSVREVTGRAEDVGEVALDLGGSFLKQGEDGAGMRVELVGEEGSQSFHGIADGRRRG